MSDKMYRPANISNAEEQIEYAWSHDRPWLCAIAADMLRSMGHEYDVDSVPSALVERLRTVSRMCWAVDGTLRSRQAIAIVVEQWYREWTERRQAEAEEM